MKQIMLYQCGVCGAQYKEKSACQKCEKNHRHPKDVKAGRWHPIGVDETGMPQTVVITFSDGSTETYHR